jgi:hypothetical protein
MELRSPEWTFSNVRMLVEYAGSPGRKIFSLRRFTGAKCANDAGEEDEKIFGSFILHSSTKESAPVLWVIEFLSYRNF